MDRIKALSAQLASLLAGALAPQPQPQPIPVRVRDRRR